MAWSKLKREFIKMLAPCVVKRVDFHTTNYRGYTRDSEGRSWITWDGEELTNMAASWDWRCCASPEDDAASVFGQGRLSDAMFRCINTSIDDILDHEDALVQALGFLDRRVGKRRLQKMDVSSRPPLDRLLFILRCNAEEVAIPGPIRVQADELKKLVKNKHVQRKRYRPERVAEHAEKVRGGQIALDRSGVDNLRQLLRDSGSINRHDLRTESGRIVFDVLELDDQSESSRKMMLHVERVGSLLGDVKFVKAIAALCEHQHAWTREPQSWQPKTKNPARQLASLARHLLVQYDMPVFMDQVWLTEQTVSHKWYCWLAAGNNIRKAPDLPIELTKSMAHHFLQAPAHYSAQAALRWGQIHALGGDAILCEAVVNTRLDRDFGDDAFWLSVFRFFIENPMLDRAHVGPIVDFIWDRRCEPVIVFVHRGVPEEREAVQPNFSMRGRTVETLLRDVEAWHTGLATDAVRPSLRWAKSVHEDYEFVEGSGEDRRLWTIQELLSTEELRAEGKRMNHCVATYDRSCVSGKCSIWSVQCEFWGIVTAHLTIELGTPDNKIRQARGKCNRLPTDEEQAIMCRWAETLG